LTPVSTVIVAYNSGEYLRRCLAALGSSHDDVVVVDNGPPGAGTSALCAEFPGVRLIERSRNEGFARAANVGVGATAGTWVLLLNPDAWPIDDAVERLVAFAGSRPGLGVTGPRLQGADGKPQRSTIRPPLSPAALAAWAAFPHAVSGAYGIWRRAGRLLPRREVGKAEFLQGAALLLRRRAFEQIGGFDESFFMYGEDADLCARLRAAGWTVELCPVASFVHVGGASTRSDPGRMGLEMLRSWLRLMAKLKGIGEAERARRWLLRALRVRALGSRRGRHRATTAWLASGCVRELLGLPE
jgi:N-acetylglucosaminyl-diphospho-decaprenol L-rhamnosyltransferase